MNFEEDPVMWLEDLLSSNNESESPSPSPSPFPSFGYCFRPSPYKVFQNILVPKLKGEWLPPKDYVKDLDVYQYDPEQIPMDETNCPGENRAYFFVPVEGTRTTPNGYWKFSERFLPIGGRDGDIIGYMNKLKFYSGKDPNGIKTGWKMVEYRTMFRVNGNPESCMVCKFKLKVRGVTDDEAYDEASGDESHSSEEETETK